MCETIESPPDSMLHKARHRHKYFVRVNNNNNNNNTSNSFSDMNPNSESDSDMQKNNNNNIGAGGNVESNYRLLTLQQYEERSGKRAAVGKKYFQQKKLVDIIFEHRIRILAWVVPDRKNEKTPSRNKNSSCRPF